MLSRVRPISVRVVAAGGRGAAGRPRGRPSRRDMPENPPKPVFQMWPEQLTITLGEIQKAYTLCHNLPGGERDACYLVYGLDAAAMEKYYPIVEMLEICMLGVPTTPWNILRAPKRKPKGTGKRNDTGIEKK